MFEVGLGPKVYGGGAVVARASAKAEAGRVGILLRPVWGAGIRLCVPVRRRNETRTGGVVDHEKCRPETCEVAVVRQAIVGWYRCVILGRPWRSVKPAAHMHLHRQRVRVASQPPLAFATVA